MNKKKIKIAILSGGPSSEHEISLKTAENIIRVLDLTKFEIFHIKITKDRVWMHEAASLELNEKEGLAYLKTQKVDLIFIALHGEYGEDGTIQSILENEGFKYTGSNSQASKDAMDKVASSKILIDSNLTVPSFISINEEDWEKEATKVINLAIGSFGLPVVVKPTDKGSSLGTTIVKYKKDIKKAAEDAFKYSENIMIQKFIKGREITCAVMEDKSGKDIPLMPTEIMPDKSHLFFDYHAKYVKGASIEITPPDLPKQKIKQIQKAAAKAHASINCTGISRSDFILANDILYILEINTIPGMTETSLLPQGAAAMGIEFSILIETIIEVALKK